MGRDDDDFDDRGDRINYRVMYPVAGRTRRRSANPRKPKKPIERSGFDFAPVKKKPEPQGKFYDEGRPTKPLMRAAREKLCEDPDIKLDDLVETMEALGYETCTSTCAGIRKEFMDIIRLAVKLGFVKYRSCIPDW